MNPLNLGSFLGNLFTRDDKKDEKNADTRQIDLSKFANSIYNSTPITVTPNTNRSDKITDKLIKEVESKPIFQSFENHEKRTKLNEKHRENVRKYLDEQLKKIEEMKQKVYDEIDVLKKDPTNESNERIGHLIATLEGKIKTEKANIETHINFLNTLHKEEIDEISSETQELHKEFNNDIENTNKLMNSIWKQEQHNFNQTVQAQQLNLSSQAQHFNQQMIFLEKAAELDIKYQDMALKAKTQKEQYELEKKRLENDQKNKEKEQALREKEVHSQEEHRKRQAIIEEKKVDNDYKIKEKEQGLREKEVNSKEEYRKSLVKIEEKKADNDHKFKTEQIAIFKLEATNNAAYNQERNDIERQKANNQRNHQKRSLSLEEKKADYSHQERMKEIKNQRAHYEKELKDQKAVLRYLLNSSSNIQSTKKKNNPVSKNPNEKIAKLDDHKNEKQNFANTPEKKAEGTS